LVESHFADGSGNNSLGHKSAKIDDVDLHIMRELQQSSKITNADLAKRIGISPPSTLERVRKLENCGIIIGYVALLNPDAVHKSIQAIVNVSLSVHTSASLQKAKEVIKQFDEVQACWHTAGDDDFLLKVIVSDMEQYERFISYKLSTVPNIGKIRTAFVLSTVKQTTAVPIAHESISLNSSRQKRQETSRTK
jgi:Lrp/AsnC family transcriptional regulator, leucine-responsive regulatory protein